MRLIPAIGALTLVWLAAPASAQMMCPTGQQAEASGQSSGMMMCGATAGQGQASEDKTKPMQMGMCPCCQNMMKKGMMKGMMEKAPAMPDMKH
jgi:hypothetical protein